MSIFSKLFFVSLLLAVFVAFPAGAFAGVALDVSIDSIALQTSGTDDPGDNSGGCAAAAVLGESDPRLDTLRLFRDEVLAKSAAGRAIIDSYYTNVILQDVIAGSPAAKVVGSNIINALMPVIELYLNK